MNTPLRAGESPIRAALYARVSSEQQAQEETIASQVAALRERVASDGLSVEEECCFLDDGYRGTTLVRPALERLRDLAAVGGFQRLYVHSPDRLARRYAYQVVLVEELRREQVEIVFLNRAIGVSPEEDLLLQMQGMFAEYERAKMLERSRRGKRHAAQRGSLSVLGGAPYGYRYLPKAQGAEAQYQVVPEQARVVEQLFEWVGRDQLSLEEVGRRLLAQGTPSPTGQPRWNRTTLWKLLKNPAFAGAARFGKTETVPQQPRLRPHRGRPAAPRRTTTKRPAVGAAPIVIAVPALVSAELFAAVQEQFEQNRLRRLGQTRHSFLLQGLLECGCCGYACTGRRCSLYVYYRCLGNDASRWGGHKLCHNQMVRTDYLDEAVWNDVVALLQNPRLLEQEQERRLEQPASATPATRLAQHLQHTQRAISRLIDAYQDGLLEKQEWEPRMAQARARLERLQVEQQRLADRAAEQAALRDTLANLERFAAEIRLGLEEADWNTRSDIHRTLIQRIQIEPEQVRITYRIRLPPFASKQRILHYCCSRVHSKLETSPGDRCRKTRDFAGTRFPTEAGEWKPRARPVPPSD